MAGTALMPRVDDTLLRMTAEQLALIAQRTETAANRAREVSHGRFADYMDGKADGLRYASEALTELLEPSETYLRPVS
jgi:hypothetical protein